MTTASIARPRASLFLIVLMFIAFISLGLPDGLLGVAWPSIRHEFGLPLDNLGFLITASVCGYLLSSFSSGWLMNRLGVGYLLAVSCIATGLGLIGYTLAPAWPIIVMLGTVAGLGAGAIDAGLNTYAASNYGEKVMQWMHASFGLGVTLGPIIMTKGLEIFGAWRFGYTLVGLAQVTLGICFAFTASRWVQNKAKNDEEKQLTDYKTPMRETLSQPIVWLSVFLFFNYTGIEVILSNWGYTLLTESRGVAPSVAGLVIGSYWGTFTVGRILAGFYTQRIGANTLIIGSVILALIGALLVWANAGETPTLIGFMLVGFAVAPVFPAMVSTTHLRVGEKHAANTIGMQMSAAGLGIAVLPSLAGILARNISLEIIPPYLVLITVSLLFFYTLSMRRTTKLKNDEIVTA